MKSATCSRTFASGASASSESTASFASMWFSLARIASTLSSSLQGGVGALDHFAEVAAAPREAGAEFVEDDRQTLAFGQAVDVAE